MSLTKFVINLAVKNPKIESFNNYLFIGPHPDDIEIGAGATVSKLKKLNKKVTFLICTDGRFGKENLTEDVSSAELITIRKNECLASAAKLGVDECRFLSLCDGGLYSDRELLEGIAAAINDVKPDIIFAPDPDIVSECHADHLRVGRAAKELANFADFKEIFQTYLPSGTAANDGVSVKAIALYFTDKPNKYVKTYGHFKKQLNALYCHASQYPKGSPAAKSLVTYLKVRAADFGLRRFAIPCEGFRMMNRTRMHCLPEASNK